MCVRFGRFYVAISSFIFSKIFFACGAPGWTHFSPYRTKVLRFFAERVPKTLDSRRVFMLLLLYNCRSR